MSESALRRWLEEGIESGETLEVLRRIGRLGPGAQETAAAVVARLAGSEGELRRVLGEVETWVRDHDLGPLAHFVSALRARSSLPRPAEPDDRDAVPEGERDAPSEGGEADGVTPDGRGESAGEPGGRA